MLAYRHDVLGMKPPEFAATKYNEKRELVHRQWYGDKFYCSLAGSQGNDGVSSPLAKPYTMSLLYQNWAAAFTSNGITSTHVCHLPRKLTTFVLSMSG